MAKKNVTCSNCGKLYTFCSSCKKDLNKPSWYATFCSENCKTLFTLATDYLGGKVSDKDAKAVIEKADLTNKLKFNKGVQKMIDKLSVKAVSKDSGTQAMRGIKIKERPEDSKNENGLSVKDDMKDSSIRTRTRRGRKPKLKREGE